MLKSVAIAPSTIAKQTDCAIVKVSTCQRPLALFRVEAISFSIRNIVEYIREARQGAKCDQRDRCQNRITRVKKPVAEDEGCEDQSVFDPLPWRREHYQCEAGAAFSWRIRPPLDRRRETRPRDGGCMMRRHFDQKIPRSGENFWAWPMAGGVQGT